MFDCIEVSLESSMPPLPLPLPPLSVSCEIDFPETKKKNDLLLTHRLLV